MRGREILSRDSRARWMLCVVLSAVALAAQTGSGQQPGPSPSPSPVPSPLPRPTPGTAPVPLPSPVGTPPAVLTHLGLVSSDDGAYAGAKAAGIRAVKIIADWNVLEPQRGQAVWGRLDRAIAGAVREGLTPVVMLAYTPRWASLGTGADLTRVEIYSRQPPRDVRDWARFVTAVAGRYRGRVKEWQVWTQLGLPHFRGTGSEYLALLQAARTALRAVDPAARVAIATPGGVDLGFITRLAQDASGAFDAVTLVPLGFAPESLLRPLAVLSARLKVAGKAIWVDWPVEAAAATDRAPGPWARLMAVAQAGGVERIFVTDTALVGPDLRQAAAVVLDRPFAGYLVRDPDVYAVVLGGAGEAALVAWATAEGRTLELPGAPAPQAALITGQAAPTETRDGRVFVRLGLAPLIATGLPAALIDEARAMAGRAPLLPQVPPDRDFSRSAEVTTRMGRQGEEQGLYNLKYRSRSNGAVEPTEAAGSEAVKTSVSRQVVYVYFDIDDTFLYFLQGRAPVEIVVEVLGGSASQQVGFNLLYDSTGGYRFTPWQWVEAREGWVTYTIRLADANMANTWGWDFAINTAGNRTADLVIRSVTVRKGAP